jgi:hypothetical protein
MLTLTKPSFTFNGAAFIGEGNRYHDYNYYYSLDWSLDANSAVSGLFSVDLRVLPKTDIRLAQKTGVSGSKVEATRISTRRSISTGRRSPRSGIGRLSKRLRVR